MKEIAIDRNLSPTTVEGHLVSFILTGELDVLELVPDNKVQYMLPVIKKMGVKSSLSEIKEKLPKECSYLDIKAVINYIKYLDGR